MQKENSGRVMNTVVTCFFVLWLAAGLPSVGHADEPLVSHTLTNGLRLLIRERHARSLVSIDLWVHAGAREEHPDEVGSAHCLEHALFKGAATQGAGKTDVAMEALGGSLDAATGPDFAHYYTTVPASRLSQALQVMAEMIRHPELPTAEIDRERGIILDELALREHNPEDRLIDRLYAMAFPDSPYHSPPGGTPAAILNCSRNTLAAFYRRCYAPDRVILALAGDCDAEKATASVTEAFGTWQSTPPLAPNRAEAETPIVFYPGIQDLAADSGEQSGVALGFPAPDAGDARMACTAQIAAALLGRFGRLSTDAWQAARADARVTPRQQPSLFILVAHIPMTSLSPQAETLALSERLLEQVRSLQTSPPSEEEFDTARSRVLGRLLYDTETDAGLARALGYAAIVGGDGPNAQRKRLQSLTREDLMRFIRVYLVPESRVEVRLHPVQRKMGGK